ncbi:aldehyde dehydrogenase family protein [Streptomyces sp. BH-SS-21]|uniref:Aldehyde dehydrogenase family protein n=1 Tax=Streptomyces liliiviolaceus TaxID=2823109 RepID=A0A940YD79_9ACTN|nr:aldehyde dehydrogenase family protein [Streptomyces liliiviolaceus]MBQ0854844.1 aldehyde dehydrogenase family protein [Streptomyces liliiviolaceus]
MEVTAAVDRVDPERWRATPPAERLRLLRLVRANIDRHFDELTSADCRAKGIDPADPADAHQVGTSIQRVLVPMAANVSAAIDLYEGLVRDRPLQPLAVTPAGDGRFDVRVSPRGKDRLLNSDRTDLLRVVGEPRRVDPYAKPGGIVAVLGAGNVASSFEMIRALFVDSCVVVHKPHHLNEDADRVWEKVLQPLVDVHAASFCPAAEGPALTRDPRLSKIYFTGGTASAKAIMEATDTELVSECGGNNPCVVVPGDRPWTEREIRHQALQIATIVTISGGSICGRTQTLVTSRHWPQRRQFLDAITVALRDLTPGSSTGYPGVDKTFEAFRDAYPGGRLIQPVDDRPASQVMVIEDVGTQGFALDHEAFCQVMSEVALDVAPDAGTFLPAAAEFANENLLGTLAATILIDEDTKKAHAATVDRAVTDLRYGAIGVNTMPPMIWTNPYLIWGGNEEGREFVSGRGNFGNLLGYENAEKSIVVSGFTSPGHLLMTNKRDWLDLSTRFARYAVRPTWPRLSALALAATRGLFRRAGRPDASRRGRRATT